MVEGPISSHCEAKAQTDMCYGPGTPRPLRMRCPIWRRWGRPFVAQYTVIGYPRTLDAHTPRAEEAIDQIKGASGRFGPRSMVWHYDPTVFMSITSADWYPAAFRRLNSARQAES